MYLFVIHAFSHLLGTSYCFVSASVLNSPVLIIFSCIFREIPIYVECFIKTPHSSDKALLYFSIDASLVRFAAIYS